MGNKVYFLLIDYFAKNFNNIDIGCIAGSTSSKIVLHIGFNSKVNNFILDKIFFLPPSRGCPSKMVEK
jgi:hypothetical protein